MKIRYFAGAGLILAFLVCLVVDRNVVRGDTFSTGATTNTIPGNVTVTGSAQFNTTISLTNDVILSRDSANTLALKNSTNATQINLYNKFTDSGNFENAVVGWNDTANTFTIRTERLGTGSGRDIRIATGGLTVNAGSVYINGSGNGVGLGRTTPNFWVAGAAAEVNGWHIPNTGADLIPYPNNTRDVGSSSQSVRSLYVGTSILLGTNVLSFSGTNLTWNGTAITIP